MNDEANKKRDRGLGMDRPTTRRDFLNGVALGAGGMLVAPHWLAALDAQAYAPRKRRITILPPDGHARQS